MIHPLAAFCTWVNAEQFCRTTLGQRFAHKDPLWVWQKAVGDGSHQWPRECACTPAWAGVVKLLVQQEAPIGVLPDPPGQASVL